MPTPRKPRPPAADATPVKTPASASFDAFRKPKDDKRSALTHEKIADDVAAFQRAGGKIEVLGVTRTLRTIAPPDPPVATGPGPTGPASSASRATPKAPAPQRAASERPVSD